MNKKNLSIYALLVSSLCYSLLGVASRLLNQGFSPMTQVYLRIFFAFLIAIIIFRKKIRLSAIKSTKAKDWFWLIIAGTLGYSVCVYFITLAVLNTKMVNVSVVYATIPFVVYFYSLIILKNKIKLPLLFLIFVSFLGVSFIASKSFSISISNFGKGEIYASLAVLTAAFWSISRKKLSNHLNNQEIASIVMFIAFLSGFIIATLKGESLNFHGLVYPGVILGLIMGATLNALSTSLETFAYKNIDIVFGNQLLMSENIFSLALGYFLYHEGVIFPETVGIVMILISIYFANKILAED